MGRSSFSSSEAELLRRLIREKQTADLSRQKTLRAQMRRMGFRISDYGEFGGFTVSDFDALVERGTISIEAPSAEASALIVLPPVISPTRASTPAPGADPLVVRRRAATDSEVAATLAALDRNPRRVPARLWPADLTGLDQCGMYAWWVDQPGAADFREALGTDVPGGRIYAGLTGATKWPSGTTGMATLRSRVGGNHINGRVRGSTFRLTLAAVLRAPLGLQPVAPRQLDTASEARLSAWIREHLEVAVHPFDEPDALADLERRTLTKLDPPLNLDGMTSTPLRTRLSDLRRRITA